MVPVGAGINLEYLFSTTDTEIWGAGSKLPHNLASLLGVLEGASGDLRTGLPKQMTEIHEPVRLLAIIEASVDTILGVAAKNAEVAELVTKGWVRAVSIDPDSGAIHVFGPDGFQPYTPEKRPLPEVSHWDAWYGGKLHQLGPARIAEPARVRPAEPVSVRCRAPDPELLLMDRLNARMLEISGR